MKRFFGGFLSLSLAFGLVPISLLSLLKSIAYGLQLVPVSSENLSDMECSGLLVCTYCRHLSTLFDCC